MKFKVNKHLHPVRIKPPFYQRSGEGSNHCGLHRYLDPNFINRYKQDIQRRQFDQTQFLTWQEEERHSRHGSEPVLRLPLHRAFHIVSCEVVCDRLGDPALDPAKIKSAGFVVRRLRGNDQDSWILEDGEAVGWQSSPGGLRDPDIRRRLCAKGILKSESGDEAYSGEETYPLHVTKTKDAAGKSHTLLYGFLPLGGFYYHRNPEQAVDKKSQEEATAFDRQNMSWPFGNKNNPSARWQDQHSHQVVDGIPTTAMFELLRRLVNRYHLGDDGLEENEALKGLCSNIGFYDLRSASDRQRAMPYNDNSAESFAPYMRESLYNYLQRCARRGGENPLVSWIAAQEEKIDSSGTSATFSHLPSINSYALLLDEHEAAEIRTLLDKRLQDQTLNLIKEIPLPKFTQEQGDLYQIIPFVRSLNDCGKEQFQWADNDALSIKFRVAAPFDPESTRPSLVQIPSLHDLRRGMAKGVAMITPIDTFNLIDKLKLRKGAGAELVENYDPPSDSGLGIQWICSFSIPIVTIVAMILLMIIVILLNLIFFWLPWVRICLPFPKTK